MERLKSYEELKAENTRLKIDLDQKQKLIDILSQKVDLYQLLMDSIPTPAFFKTLDGKYFIINKAFSESIIGLSKKETEGRTIKNFPTRIIPDDLKLIYMEKDNALLNSKTDSQFYVGEVQLANKKRESHYFIKTKVKNPQGNIQGITCIMINLSQNQKAMINSSITNLAGGIAHIINNSLAAIMGNLELISDETINKDCLNNESLDYLNEVMNGCDRIKDCVDQLLAYSQKGNISLQKVNINNTIDNTLKIMEHSFEENGIIINKKLTIQDMLVKADKTKLHIVLSSILTNAIESCKINDQITVKTKLVNKEKKFYVKIIIKDSGEGISNQIISKVFEPFFTTKFQGRGMSLAACQGIIETIGGWINIESTKGIGTEVSIYIPRLFE